MDEIPCCQVEADEERFLKIIEEAIKEKEVKPYKAFTNGELRKIELENSKILKPQTILGLKKLRGFLILGFSNFRVR